MEMIGVVAVVAILATLLVPRIMAAIADADLAADVLSIKGVRSAVEGYFKRYGKIAGVGGAALTSWNNNAYEYWDQQVLLPEQLLEKPFVSRLATNCYIRVIVANTNLLFNPLVTGNYGSLGSQYCNNGAYDLIREYAAVGYAPPQLNAYALGRAPVLFQAPAWADFLVSLVARRGASSLTEAQNLGADHLPTGLASLKAGSRWLHWFQANGLQPMEAIVLVPHNSLPSGTPAPSRGEGSVVPPPGTSVSHTGSDQPTPYHNDACSGSYGVEVVLQGVSLADAYRLSLAIDGPTQSNWAYWDSQGRVKYDFVSAQVGNVFIYLDCK